MLIQSRVEPATQQTLSHYCVVGWGMCESKGLQGHKINVLATTVWTTLTLEVLLRTRECRRTIRAYRLLDGADLLACTGADRQPVMSPGGMS